jgi:hypothetical protein
MNWKQICGPQRMIRGGGGYAARDLGGAMAKAVNRRGGPRSHPVNLRGMLWIKGHTGQVSFRVLSVPLSISFHRGSPYSELPGGWTTRPFVATVQRHSLTPSTWTSTKFEHISKSMNLFYFEILTSSGESWSRSQIVCKFNNRATMLRYFNHHYHHFQY